MKEILDEIRTVIPQVPQWTRETLEHEAVLYRGSFKDWRLQVVALGEIHMATAFQSSKLLVIKMTDELAQLTLKAARSVR